MRTCAPRPNDEVAPANRAASPLTRSATAAGRGGAALADATPTAATATREIRPCPPGCGAFVRRDASRSVVAAFGSSYRGTLHDLAIDDGRAGVRLAPTIGLTNRLAKPIVGSVQPAVDPPLTEMVVERLPERLPRRLPSLGSIRHEHPRS